MTMFEELMSSMVADMEIRDKLGHKHRTIAKTLPLFVNLGNGTVFANRRFKGSWFIPDGHAKDAQYAAITYNEKKGTFMINGNMELYPKAIETVTWAKVTEGDVSKYMDGNCSCENPRFVVSIKGTRCLVCKRKEIIKARHPLLYMTDEALDVNTYSVCGVCSTPIAKGDSYCTTHDAGPDNIPCIMCGDKSTGIGKLYCDTCRSKDGKL